MIFYFYISIKFLYLRHKCRNFIVNFLRCLTDEKDKKDYLSSLYSELYVKDIVERNGIEREDILNDILDFLASQISSLTNPTNIANTLTSMKN